jgi:hypothetical protein
MSFERTSECRKMNAGQQQKQIEALSTGLEKVNKQLQPSSSAPQIAANDY